MESHGGEYCSTLSLVDPSHSQNEGVEAHMSDPNQSLHDSNGNRSHVSSRMLVDGGNSHHTLIPLEEEVVYGPPHGSRMGRVYKKGYWVVEEMMVLQGAKREDRDRHEHGVKGNQNSAQERWNWIEDKCWNNGVQRSAQQCHDKWEVISTAYRKVYNNEKYVCHGQKSYWIMSTDERKKNKLPPNFQREVFNALLDWCNTNTKHSDSGELVVDTSGLLGPSGNPFLLSPSCPNSCIIAQTHTWINPRSRVYHRRVEADKSCPVFLASPF